MQLRRWVGENGTELSGTCQHWQKRTAAKLTDRADANLPSGTSGVAMMLMAATEQELTALLRPVLELIPIPDTVFSAAPDRC